MSGCCCCYVALQHVQGKPTRHAAHAVAAGGNTLARNPAFETMILPPADVDIPGMLCAGTGCICAPVTCCCSSTRALQMLLLVQLLEKSNTGSKGHEHSTCAARSSPLVPNLGFMQHGLPLWELLKLESKLQRNNRRTNMGRAAGCQTAPPKSNTLPDMCRDAAGDNCWPAQLYRLTTAPLRAHQCMHHWQCLAMNGCDKC